MIALLSRDRSPQPAPQGSPNPQSLQASHSHAAQAPVTPMALPPGPCSSSPHGSVRSLKGAMVVFSELVMDYNTLEKSNPRMLNG